MFSQETQWSGILNQMGYPGTVDKLNIQHFPRCTGWDISLATYSMGKRTIGTNKYGSYQLTIYHPLLELHSAPWHNKGTEKSCNESRGTHTTDISQGSLE